MLPRKAPKIASTAAAAPVEGRDHISNLPDSVLQHMLSFLRAQDVVWTCVLAKRWRHMWESTTVLRFVCSGMKERGSVEEIQEFVDHLLRLCMRGGTSLDTCEFRLDEDCSDVAMARINLWIRIALQCKVRVLQLFYACNMPGMDGLHDHPFFISQYLKKLKLVEVNYMMPSGSLDFSFCPNLEDLEIVDGYLLGGALLISSQSLKRLTFECCSFGDEYRMSICAPNLVSLWLEVDDGIIPSLQSMPSLLAAYVKIDSSVDFDGDDDDDGDDDEDNQSILLQGLSDVRNLVLISRFADMFVFKRDLEFCSSFNKLKSLLLDEYWCQPADDFSALACLLKLSPVLEKLTLQLYSKGPKHKAEIKLSCKPLEMSAAISQHLKTLEVKCEVYDDRVNNVLTFLSKQLNICFQFSG